MSSKDPKKASQKQDWHPEDIKAALRKKGITLSRLAQMYGLSDSTSFSACLVRSSPANEKRIGEQLGMHPKELWPTRYNEDGTRKPVGSHALKCTADNAVCNGNERAAA